MLQLFRSMIEQPETKDAFQCSQSFATLSSQLSTATSGSSSQQRQRSVIESIEVIECIKRCMHQSATSKRHVYKVCFDMIF